MNDEDDRAIAASGGQFSLPAGCLREYWEYLRMVELRGVAAYERGQEQSRLSGEPNLYEGLPEACAQVRESADFLLEATKAGPNGERIPDIQQVMLPRDRVEAWYRGLMRESARMLLQELDDAQAGRATSHSAKCQSWLFLEATSLFSRKTGLSMQDLGMVVADVVQKEEFAAFRDKSYPWWLDDFCRLYHYPKTEALEAYRRTNDPEFREGHQDILEALRHCDTWISWLKAEKCMARLNSDPEIAADLKRLLDSLPSDVWELDFVDLRHALEALRALDAKWRERHGEPPQDEGKT